LFSAYKILFEAVRTHTSKKATYQRMTRPRKSDPMFTEESVAAVLALPNSDEKRIEVLNELQTARKIRRRDEDRYAAELKAQLDEEENTRQAEVEGLMGECGCCYSDYPLNRLVHCNGEVPHSFCRDCARRNAETEVGKSKYELNCMSVDACTGGFSLDQR
jgi:TRIAD3 protein (E3 ubiquitin-protein ligase RNF216)